MSSPNFANLLFELADGVARITLNRPERLNSFNVAMHEELREALAIVAADRGGEAGLDWAGLQGLLAAFWQLVSGHIEPRARAGRLKQWLHYLRRRHPEAGLAYAAVRTLNDPVEVASHLGLLPAAPWRRPVIEPCLEACA